MKNSNTIKIILPDDYDNSYIIDIITVLGGAGFQVKFVNSRDVVKYYPYYYPLATSSASYGSAGTPLHTYNLR
jgi:hypothetical protein